MLKIWLPDMDLNHDKQIQSLLCYRYTIGQTRGLKVEPQQNESRPVRAWKRGTMGPQALSLTPRFSGVPRGASGPNRFSGFWCLEETAEAVQALRQREIPPLKRGVNERATIQGRATHEISGLMVPVSNVVRS